MPSDKLFLLNVSILVKCAGVYFLNFIKIQSSHIVRDEHYVSIDSKEHTQDYNRSNAGITRAPISCREKKRGES